MLSINTIVKIVSMLLMMRFNNYDIDQQAIHDGGQQAILDYEHAIHDSD